MKQFGFTESTGKEEESETQTILSGTASSMPLSQLSIFTKGENAFEKYDSNKKKQLKIGYAPKMLNSSVFELSKNESPNKTQFADFTFSNSKLQNTNISGMSVEKV